MQRIFPDQDPQDPVPEPDPPPPPPPLWGGDVCDPEPALWPSRPLWSQVPHKPDYVNISNNFNIQNTLTIAASIFEKATTRIKDNVSFLDGRWKGRCECAGTPQPGCEFDKRHVTQLECEQHCAPNGPAGQCGATGVSRWAVDEAPGNCMCEVGDIDGNGVHDSLDWVALSADCQATLYREDINRSQCPEVCSTAAATACGATGQIIWGMTDMARSLPFHPDNLRAAVRHIRWVDKVMDFVSSPQLASVLNGLGHIQEKLENWSQIVGLVGHYADQFSEGYHIGAYSEQRPDLLECIGWAGSGVYAPMLSLLGGKASLGARYTAHQLSATHRAQLHLGGFALEFNGRQFTFAPGVSAQLQLEGFRGWDAMKPFGLFDMSWAGPGVRIADSGTRDVFSWLTDQDVSALDSNGDGWINPFEFIIKDYYPFDYVATPGGPTTWARPGVDADWEGHSRAVWGVGLNLPLEVADTRTQLPGIPLWPGVTLYPYFKLGYGVEWFDRTNKLLDRIVAMINRNLPYDRWLKPDDLGRDMHAMQAPDLSNEQGITAHVEPEVGADLTLGIKLFKFIRLGITAHIGVGARLAPGGFGGLVDVSTGLFDMMNKINPPADLPCKAQYSNLTRAVCSNTGLFNPDGSRASSSDYACHVQPGPDGSGGGSCTITGFDLGGNQLFRLCIDEWLGVDPDMCTTYNGLALLLGNYVPADLLEKVSKALDDNLVGHSWSTSSCQGQRDTVAVANWAWGSASACEQHGSCDKADGTTLQDVTRTDCDGTFTAYTCLHYDEPQLVGWDGPGCSPLDTGFISAIGCKSNADCAAGETCDWESGGRCVDSAYNPVQALCDAQNTCPGGRTCRDGACYKSCGSVSECGSGLECSAGACVPPGGMPSAEAVLASVNASREPLHTAASYALSQAELAAYLAAGIRIELLLKIFGRERKIFRFAWHDDWDLFSVLKTHYQPGLASSYQDECQPSFGQVTNHAPGSVTRVPDPLSPTIDTPDELIAWCKDELPGAYDDPPTNTNDGLAGDFTNLQQFAQATGVDLFGTYQLCIGGRPFGQALADPSTIGNARCSYTDPQTGLVHQFACQDADDALLGAWGCLATNRSLTAALLAGWLPTHGYPGAVVGGQFVISPMLIDPDDELSMSNLRPDIVRASRSFIYRNLGATWLNEVNACFEARYDAESACTCSSSAQCEAGASCQGGACIAADGEPAQCPIVMLEPMNMGPCCGDGVLMAGEGCDDGNTQDGDGCSSSCTPTTPPVVCGDWFCDSAHGESVWSCPQDCGTCGDGLCQVDRGEPWSCTTDCGTTCNYNYDCEYGEQWSGSCSDCVPAHCDHDWVCEDWNGEVAGQCSDCGWGGGGGGGGGYGY